MVTACAAGLLTVCATTQASTQPLRAAPAAHTLTPSDVTSTGHAVRTRAPSLLPLAGRSVHSLTPSTPRPRPTLSAHPGLPGFETANGWCGPTRPRRGALLVEIKSDGVHPTCLSLAIRQRLRVANRTNSSGRTGVGIAVELPGSSRRVLSPGTATAFLPMLPYRRDTLHISTSLHGLTHLAVTIWRVNPDGTLAQMSGCD